ncbi:hypothetical protein KGD82_16845 [Nocardiopsis eucommiae]|uniref:Uncharacterized protein n=1 Tax=Nocardiopsis eucommiae TaxID=2831970 RepID=A0A975QJL4_9ACTN|nr:hypothetical protein KGD82_16845 [Nocardiopsis eucommiae]
MISSRIHSPYLLLSEGLPWTVIVARADAAFHELSGLFTDLDPDVKADWLARWGIPSDDDPWAYIDPDTLCRIENIPESMRLPTEFEERILACV